MSLHLTTRAEICRECRVCKHSERTTCCVSRLSCHSFTTGAAATILMACVSSCLHRVDHVYLTRGTVLSLGHW